MPRAELDESPKGLPKGAEKEQASFVQQTGGSADPLQSAVNVPAPPEKQKEFVPPPETQEAAPPHDIGDGFNLDDVLYGPTDRPTEPVTAQPGQIRISEMLQQVAQQYATPDVLALLQAAQNHGL